MSMLTDVETKISTWYDNTKAWFKRSTTIFYARLQVLGGVMLGAFSGVDWTAVAHLDWANIKNSFLVAGGMVLNGLFTEILRRRTISSDT